MALTWRKDISWNKGFNRANIYFCSQRYAEIKICLNIITPVEPLVAYRQKLFDPGIIPIVVLSKQATDINRNMLFDKSSAHNGSAASHFPTVGLKDDLNLCYFCKWSLKTQKSQTSTTYVGHCESKYMVPIIRFIPKKHEIKVLLWITWTSFVL